MNIHVEPDKNNLGRMAAACVAESLRETLQDRGEANVIFATGASQFDMFHELVRLDLDWNRVNCFHLDEYLGLSDTHPASFRRYLKERFCEQVNGPKMFHWVQGDSPDPSVECDRLGKLIRQHPIDVACIGIGENSHLAFNDPPADFETEDPYLVVELDEACRRQQMGEGWFSSFEDVPSQAISMSIRQILKSAEIVCTVPDQRKAQAVRAAVEGPVTPEVPASILQQHPHVAMVLDTDSASLLQAQK
jgi:glucosamine-6-phosphate deaminase